MDMSQTTFRVYYDGEALKESEMDVKELAPALLAFGELLEESNRVLNGDKATVTVKVKAFQAGCFGIDFEVIQSVLQHVKNLFADGTTVREAVDLLNLLGISPFDATVATGGGLLYLLKKAKGRKPKSRTVLESGNVRIYFEEGEPIETTPDVVDLYVDEGVRRAISHTMAPLEKDGIDSFCIGWDNKREEIATKEDVSSFAPPAYEPVLLSEDEEPQERYFSIISLSFKDDNKWRLSDGTSSIYAMIEDRDFLNKMERNAITFAKNDLLLVRLKTRQLQCRDGLKTEYVVVKVVEHIKAVKQMHLPISEVE